MTTYQQPPPQAQFGPPSATYPPSPMPIPNQDPYGFQQYNHQNAGPSPPIPQSQAQLIPLPRSRTSSHSSHHALQQQQPPPPSQQQLTPYAAPPPPAPLQQQQSSYYAPPSPLSQPQLSQPQLQPQPPRHHRTSSSHSHHSSASRRDKRPTLGDTLFLMWDALKQAFTPTHRR